jgi:regulator of nonsense transcripts 2
LDYYDSVRSYLVKEHKAMHKRERRNHEILTSKGEISEERRQENEAAQKLYDSLNNNTSKLAVSILELIKWVWFKIVTLPSWW